MSLRSILGQKKRSLKKAFRWLGHEFPKAPGLELYSKGLDRQNGRLVRALRQGGNQAFQDYVAPYLGHDIPRILWIFWAQGEDAAPPLVQSCIASWRQHNPDWDIRVLNNDSANLLVELSDFPAHLPFRFKADLLRLRLLARYGGVWADATTYCHRPLNDWMPLLGGQTGFFVFSSPHSDRWISSWFIAAHSANPLIVAWHDSFTTLISRSKLAPSKYFMIIYCFQWRLLRDPALMTHFRRIGSLPAVPCLLLQGALEDKIGDQAPIQAIQRGLPVSKLSWKALTSEDRLNDLLHQSSA